MMNSNRPFEDPELFGLLPQHAIKHTPGMADALMQQLAPLLAADGFDLDNLDEDVDIEQLNAAMARAVERHNMQLVTPVGDDHARAVNTLREIVQALAQDQDARVQYLLSTIGPESTPHRPSAGHVTGVALDSLDKWYTDDSFRAVLQRATVPKWNAKTQTVAQDLQALARKRRAYASHNSLILNHGGFQLLRASVYLVSATVTALADYSQAPYLTVLDEILPRQEVSTGFAKGAAFGPVATQQTVSQDYVGRFEAWLHHEDENAEVAQDVIQVFAGLVDDAQQAGIDPHRPDEFEYWIDLVYETTDIGVVMVHLDIMHDYVHFRLATDEEPAHWEEPHSMLMAMLGGDNDMPDEFAEIIAEAEHLSETERAAALNQLPVVSGLFALRDWLATSKGITPSRVPRRADIGTVADMIGLVAEGVAKLPEHVAGSKRWPDFPESAPDDQAELHLADLPDRDRIIYVRSALDLPELVAWWSTLIELEIITLTSTRVKLGPTADEYISSSAVPLEQAEGVVATYISNILTSQLGNMRYEATALGMTIKQLIDTMRGEYTQRYVLEAEDEIGTMMMELISDRHFQYLEDAGLLKVHGDEIRIPQSLHIPLTVGLLMTLQDLAYSMDVMDDLA